MRRSYVNREVDEQIKKIELDLQIYGYAQADIDRIAEYLFELIFFKIPRGELTLDPSYIGRVPGSDEFSRYRFLCGPFTGVYTASASEVKYENIELIEEFLLECGQGEYEGTA